MIFVAGCVIGYVVYRHSKNGQLGSATGDPAAAIACAVAVVTLLAFLFGAAGGPSAQAGEGGSPATPSPSTSTYP
ncbi:hypothetical protein [Streptomyces sp. NPDC096032]